MWLLILQSNTPMLLNPADKNGSQSSNVFLLPDPKFHPTLFSKENTLYQYGYQPPHPPVRPLLSIPKGGRMTFTAYIGSRISTLILSLSLLLSTIIEFFFVTDMAVIFQQHLSAIPYKIELISFSFHLIRCTFFNHWMLLYSDL